MKYKEAEEANRHYDSCDSWFKDYLSFHTMKPEEGANTRITIL